MQKLAALFKSVVGSVLLVASSVSLAGVQTKVVEYKDGGTTFQGLVARPDNAKGNLPGILMIHNWMGVTDETKRQAERVAALGYVVFAADIYGKGVRPTSPKEAGEQATKYKTDRALFRSRLKLGLETLKAQPGVKGADVIAAGYCFGGTGALELARSGAPLKGVVSFHGGLDSPTPADGANIKGRVLVLHGADDPFEKPEDLAAFENELRTNHVDWELVKFGGAVHSFTEKAAGNDNSKGAAYNAAADARSFAAFKEFAKQVL